MKLLLLLTTFGATLAQTNFIQNPFISPKSASKFELITSFDDFIATPEELKSYYGDITLLTGEDLINKVENVISKNNFKPSYDGDVPGDSRKWVSYYLLDRDYDLSPLNEIELKNLKQSPNAWWNATEVYCDVLYEPESILVSRDVLNKNVSGKKKISIDREHVVPKSYGFNKSNTDDYKKYMAGVDMHNLHMGESESNQKAHNDLVYGNVSSNKQEYISKNSGKVGSYRGKHATYNLDDDVFEPIDRNKGDIARSVLYMGTRYHTYQETSDVGIINKLVLNDNPYKFKSTVSPEETKTNETSFGILSDILDWNIVDDVTDHERIRNTLCQLFIQGNRNPYTDFPKWADVAFNPNSLYYADINEPDGVKLKLDLADKSVIKDKYGTAATIDLSKIEVEQFEDGVIKVIPASDLSFYLTNLSTGDKKQYNSTDAVVFAGEGDYKLTIKIKQSGKEIIKNFKVGDFIDSDFNGEFKKMYQGDTLEITNYYLTDKSGNKVDPSSYTYYLVNETTSTETKLEDKVVLGTGNYRLRIEGSHEGAKCRATSETFEVKPLQESVGFAPNIEQTYKTGYGIDLSKAIFQYIRNGEKIIVPNDQLTYKIIQKINKKEYTPDSKFTFKESGDYILEVSYKTPDGIDLKKEVEFEVKQAQFWEDPKFQKLLFLVLAIIFGLIFIGVIIVLIRKLVKRK